MNQKLYVRAWIFKTSALLVWFVLSGCGHKPQPAPIIAQVGNASITQPQLQARYSLPAEGDSAAAQALEEAARDWAANEILVQEALRQGLDQDSIFKARMENLRRELLIRRLYDRAAAGHVVDTVQVMEEYKGHQSEYLTSADQVDLVYILAPSRDLADQARKSLQGGLALSGILAANEFLTGQAIGWVSQADLDPTVARAAFTQVPGGISYPLKRDDGRYLVVQVRQRRMEGTIKPLEEVFDEIRGHLQLRHQAETEKALRDSLWVIYKPQILINSGVKSNTKESP